MNDQFDSNDENLKEKFKILLVDEHEIKKWNEGLLIKLLILLPLIIFAIGLFIVNRPANLYEALFILTYPLALVSIGLINLFLMRSNLK